MTRNEILEMKPGRELDALIGRNVFGYRLCSVHDDDDYHFFYGQGDIEAYSPLPHFSTDISAAWKMFESDGFMTRNIELNTMTKGYEHLQYTVKLIRSVDVWKSYKVYSLTAPEAICKAVLISLL